MTIQTINIGTTPNDDTGDDPRTAGQKLNSNFTTSTHAASRDVGTASGNVMEVGAGGLLADLFNAEYRLADVDDRTTVTGFYYTDDLTVGALPPYTVGVGYGTVTIKKFTANDVEQQWENLSSNSPEIFIRRWNGASWSDWQELYHSGNLNPNVFGGLAAGDELGIGGIVNSTRARIRLELDSPTAPVSITVDSTFSLEDYTGVVIATGLTGADFALLGASSNKLAVFNVNNITGATAKDGCILKGETASSKITVNF